MSSVATATTLALSITLTGTVYSFLAPFRAKQTKDRTRIQELEEEIIRLKREMRICGIRTSSFEDKKDST